MNDAVVTPGAEEQLVAIASLSRALDQKAIDYWRFGGWAVDFWVGRVTREHDDIDVAAWRNDYDAIGTALKAVGWRHTPVPDEVVGTRYLGQVHGFWRHVGVFDAARACVAQVAGFLRQHGH